MFLAGRQSARRPPSPWSRKISKKQPRHLLQRSEEYLAEPAEDDVDVDALRWWAAKETKCPALPNMIKQYFSAPVSPAGVERVFSAASNMHGDLQKSAKDSTLEHSLLAAFNTD